MIKYTVLHSIATFKAASIPKLVYGPLQTVSDWIHYRGCEVPAFDAYMRLRQDKIVIANIIAPTEQRGRMNVICAACEALSPIVQFENVLNPHLANYLERRGYVRDADPDLPHFYMDMRGKIV
jgi:hypothetical protein